MDTMRHEESGEPACMCGLQPGRRSNLSLHVALACPFGADLSRLGRECMEQQAVQEEKEWEWGDIDSVRDFN